MNAEILKNKIVSQLGLEHHYTVMFFDLCESTNNLVVLENALNMFLVLDKLERDE